MAGGKKSPRTKIPAARVKEAADVAAALQREASGSKHERDGYQQGMESVAAEAGDSGDITYTKTAEGQARHKAWAQKQPLRPRVQTKDWPAFLQKLLMVTLSTAGLCLFGYRMWLQQLSRTQGPYMVYTPDKLAEMTHEQGDRILLAILGEVYDVSKNPAYYGVDGGYEFFTGRDASRAFVTGKFADDLNDNVTDFTDAQMGGLVHWKDFFLKEYTYVGRVAGAFFDEQGHVKDQLREVLAATRRAKAAERERKSKKSDHPDCNKRWSQAKGGEVWCDDGLYPRMLTEAINDVDEKRCACFSQMGWSSRRELFPDCSPSATRCPTTPSRAEPVAAEAEFYVKTEL